MTQITIKVSGATVVRQGLQNLADEIPKIGRQQIYETAQRAKKRMQEYPPERPNQRYVRTFRLRSGWVVQAAGDTGYRLVNDVPYTPYVVGDAYGREQASVHVGRWQLVRSVVEEEVKTLERVIQDHIRLAIRRNNL